MLRSPDIAHDHGVDDQRLIVAQVSTKIFVALLFFDQQIGVYV